MLKFDSMKTKSLILVFVLFFSAINFTAQNNSNKTGVYVDDSGVMRWEKTNKEVEGFGVNYTVPFAHAYRSAKKMGINPKEAIDNDVYHFSRLGFDLYRIHVWDTQISDTLGNLLENEYLDTFDYLLKKLKEKNINYVITPIAFWGDGWPEPDGNTPGFSHKYGKGDCLTNPDAIKAQQNYLYQFLNHVNPYTGEAYKTDPNLIAFEVSNEPHHRGEAEKVTEFVKGMVDAMRKTGTKKPIFYNISHAVHFADAYFNAGIQGGTFQWYPTGLGYQRELSGNLLPNVNDYNIPFDETIKKYKAAKLVYEFDAADVGKSYIYPVMARSFREAGIQIATHFAYDPTYLAYANTEYNTHYMNLVYTPQKALSLMICSEVFHKTPMYKDFGKYPENTTFDSFNVDYQKDLAEYNSDKKFIYSNNTNSQLVNEKKLNKIAGFGNSSVVKYNGVGAYFLDKIDKGIWRLEVMPDAVWVDNPFGTNSPKKTVGVIKWEERTMNITLKDLDSNFNIKAINEGNNFSPKVVGNSFSIMPGTYILSKNGISKKWSASDNWKNIKLNDYFAPKTTVAKIYFKHNPINEISEGTPLEISTQIVAPQSPIEVELWVYNGYKREVIKMEWNNGYNYSGVVPANIITTGYLKYQIIVKGEKETRTYPADKEGMPYDWDFYDRSTFETRVVSSANAIQLFNAKKDAELLVKPWKNTLKLVPTENNEDEYQLNIEKLFVVDNENLNAAPIYDYSFKHFILDKIKGRKLDLASKETIVFKGRALNNKPCKLQIAFVMNDGAAFGKVIEIGTEIKEYKLSIKELKPVKTVTLPRPYPSFLPYYLEHNLNVPFDIENVESMQFSIGPEIPKSELDEKHGIAIISAGLE
ncbi:cellulase (glycosyl hydrolase family 5) [Lutibacter oceani]|uniref:Cellulase (Glycosyl hydrolase family 5) n=2 Tax=Lutibacter oceani TaxID=1853311 RepID=A0A3D9RU58_9FLAO|nr:cellulase (glycosyl hydrolase family 5) [Lutibacter oceani]